uniref:Uncharacterized protein n=1 Tax=Rhizophora mucronata TaxID=61149 RepID=A0A2P2PCM6_RHIMU
MHAFGRSLCFELNFDLLCISKYSLDTFIHTSYIARVCAL